MPDFYVPPILFIAKIIAEKQTSYAKKYYLCTANTGY